MQLECTTPIKPILGFPGYGAGLDGTIWSFWVRLKGGKKNMRVVGDKPHMLRVRIDEKTGRRHISLSVNGKSFNMRVACLVASAFHGPKPDGMECRHLDGNKLNDHAENLRWGTRLENAADRALHGGYQAGVEKPNAKLTDAVVVEIRRLSSEGVMQKVIASRFNLPRPYVSMIVSGKRWRHLLDKVG